MEKATLDPMAVARAIPSVCNRATYFSAVTSEAATMSFPPIERPIVPLVEIDDAPVVLGVLVGLAPCPDNLHRSILPRVTAKYV